MMLLTSACRMFYFEPYPSSLPLEPIVHTSCHPKAEIHYCLEYVAVLNLSGISRSRILLRRIPEYRPVYAQFIRGIFPECIGDCVVQIVVGLIAYTLAVVDALTARILRAAGAFSSPFAPFVKALVGNDADSKSPLDAFVVRPHQLAVHCVISRRTDRFRPISIK